MIHTVIMQTQGGGTTMKSRIRGTVTALLLLVTFFSVTLLLRPLTASGQETYRGEGKDQLVRALDAAIARVIDSGQWRDDYVR